MNPNSLKTEATLQRLEQQKLRIRMKDTKKQNSDFAILSVINFIYFTANFADLSFIRQIWEGEGQSQHFQSKMDNICKKYEPQGYLPSAAILDFFFLLSRNNQGKFIAWVQSNYHFSEDHKTQ